MTKKHTAVWLRGIVIAAFLLLALAALLTPARAEEPTYAVTFDDNGGMHDVGPEAGAVKVYSAENYPGVTITAKSAEGEEYADDDHDGVLQLPDGTYEFHIACQHNHIVGDVTVAGADTGVSIGMWDFDDWVDVEGLRMSNWSGMGGITGGTTPTFDEGELEVDKGDHVFHVTVPDVNTCANVRNSGRVGLSVWMKYNPDVFSEEEYAAKIPMLMYYYHDPYTGELVGLDRINDSYLFPFMYNNYWMQWSISGLMFLPKDSPEGGSGGFRVFIAKDCPTYLRYQEYTVVADRFPTLSALEVRDARGNALTPAVEFSADPWAIVYNSEYRTPSQVKQVVITPTPLNADYEITVNGQPLTDGSATVDMDMDETGHTVSTVVAVKVRAGEYSTDYTVTLTPEEPKRITFNTVQPGTTVEVFNKDGEVMLPASSRLGDDGCWSYLYLLTEGETYSYIATRGEYFHSSRTFRMEEEANKTFTVRVIDDEDWLDDLTFQMTYWADGRPFSWLMDPIPEFHKETHSYDLIVRDCDGDLFFTAWFDDALDVMVCRSGPGIGQWNRREDFLYGVSGKQLKVNTMFAYPSAAPCTVTLRPSRTEDGVTYYQDYDLHATRFCTLYEIGLSCEGRALALEQEYVRGDLALSVKAPYNATSMTVYAPHMPYRSFNWTENYYVKVNGVLTVNDLAEVPLSGTVDTETVYIEVGSVEFPEATRTIELTVIKTSPVFAAVDYGPEQAVLTLRNDQTTERIWPDEEGRWRLNSGYTFTYTLTAPGYVGKRGTVAVTENAAGETILVLDGDEDDPIQTEVETTEDGTRLAAALSLSIPAAPENPNLDHTMEAEWADFRGTSYTWDADSGKLVAGGSANTNNGVVSAPTPVDAADSTLYWANGIGFGYSSKAVSSPILVDGDLVVYAADRLYRVDLLTGAVKAEAQMAASSAFAINPPFYHDGMIFVALSHGKIQAFDAATLQSLWIYTDPEGGQPNSNITIYNGYLYTGFWVGEQEDANFVCLTVTDEDPTRGDEPKYATWTHLQPGGFYWAGAYVCDDFLLVGTDDGQEGITHTEEGKPEYNWSAELLLLDPRTGAVLDKRSGLKCDIRCTISYDAVTDAYYFTSKGGCFYQAKVTQDENGDWKISALRSLDLDNYYVVKTSPPMSTSTPVIYNGRAYIGVSGIGQFAQYYGHNITVIDLESWSIAYKVPTQGYPQTSGLLTTAYAQTGWVYVYFFDNFTPGVLRMLRDRPGQTAPDPITVEYYTKTGTTKAYETPYVIFTPVGEQAQYAICSPICDEYGVIYFKNDSGYLMAFGPSIEKLEVTTQPARTAYEPGESFDPTGMVVTMTYANGMTRDVTEHVLWSAEPLEEGETEITLRYPTLYHNEDNADGTSTAGVRGDTAFASVGITVGAQRGTEYRIEEIRVLNGDAQSVDVIPEGSFTAEIRVTNLSAAAADALVLAAYDANGRMLGLYTLDVVAEQGQTVRLEKPLDNSTGGIAKLKAFMLPKGGSPTPLAEAATFGG